MFTRKIHRNGSTVYWILQWEVCERLEINQVWFFVSVNCTRTLLAIILLTLQCWRRLYDTNFVSVFGKNSKMHLGHYILGFLHYTACVLTILGGASNFSMTYPSKPVLQWVDLNVMDLFATYLFLWAWWHQYKVTVILANLRKDGEGKFSVETALLSHWWYQEKFEDYPRNRKIIFPCIY
ncbi:dfg10 protein [Holotrichia oblita]|uniref:Dfg10 protein n=1 Tax=Holotrichia oblita TaxID=644536 RepID=A0ACB9T7T2_HOLOL|nr:dfg10 protein [Holotrichia oblita]